MSSRRETKNETVDRAVGKRKSIVIGLSGLLVIGAIYFSLSGDSEQEVADELLRRDSARKQAAIRDASSNEHEGSAVDEAFEALAAAGKGMPVPNDLVATANPGGYWFVGKRGNDVGVELPFAPGRLPTPPPKLTALEDDMGFVGADACQKCHTDRHASFVQTAHHRTSAPANPQTVAGSFEPARNTMTTHSPDVGFEMIRRGERLFQRTSFFDWKFEVPFDIVTGSSKIAQSYLYWHDDGLYQMHVTYLAEVDDWINSPGFIDGDSTYARQIGKRCLECHTTYIDVREPKNHFTPGSVIFGISCERCHGPGREHVEYHEANPNELAAKFIAHPGTLSRQQKLDLCGQCHFGGADLKGKPYQFRPGDQLSDHYHPPKADGQGSVHTSNQLARLQLTPCFTQTEMTCIDCHNPHQLERGDTKLFSERCIKCHETSQCGMADSLGPQISDDCISCHMPSRASDKLWMNSSEGKVFPPLRDHHIRIDTNATDAFLQSLEK